MSGSNGQESRVLPPLYLRWLDPLLGAPLPVETAATCDACAMLPRTGGAPAHGALHFDPRVKCCTYVPRLPNFLVGSILADADPAAAHGQEALRARLTPGPHLTPLGLDPPATFTTLYRSSREALFGRAPDLRCPHYVPDGGACGIWQHRPARCATWFCKHTLGARGHHFWASVFELLRRAERAVSLHCARTVGVEPHTAQALLRDQGPTLTADSVGGSLDDTAYAKAWGKFVGHEAEYFTACADLASAMSWEEVLTAGGVELAMAADVVRAAYGALRPQAPPARPRLTNLRLVAEGSDRVRLVGYSPLDPLVVPRGLLAVLPFFDGRPLDDALAAARDAGIAIDRDVIARLADFGVLQGELATHPGTATASTSTRSAD